MSGYVPLFDSIATGTLYGRWPDIGVWPIVLALADKHGHLDVTPHYLSGVLGLPVEQVAACMKRFCEPDIYSRTKEESGARLRLLDDHRDWGWAIVNHVKYREKARLMGKNEAEVSSGKNAERLRDRRRPPLTPSDPLSDSYADADSNKETTALNAPDYPAVFLDFKIVYPNRAGDQGWRKAIRAWSARLHEGHTELQMVDGAKRYAEYVRSTGSEGTEYVKQAATFVGPDKYFLLPWVPPPPKGGAPKPNNEAAWAEAKARAKDLAFRAPFSAETPTSYMAAMDKNQRDQRLPPIAERRGLAGIKRIGVTP